MDLESRGIPGGYILSEEFREADLAQAKAARFYCAVADVGLQFVRLEKQYLAMAV